VVPCSGLRLRGRYKRYEAEGILRKQVEKTASNPDCLCGEVLCGLKVPSECKLFAKTCAPEFPLGPCMVSSEGTCAAYYRYRGKIGEEKNYAQKIVEIKNSSS
jgi:hydrogenase expression/formation protein HypD